MGVEKGVAKGRIREKHLLDIAEITKVPKSIWEGGPPPNWAMPKIKGIFFLGFVPSYYMSTVAHCSPSSPQNLALNIWVGKLHRMVGPTQNLV